MRQAKSTTYQVQDGCHNCVYRTAMGGSKMATYCGHTADGLDHAAARKASIEMREARLISFSGVCKHHDTVMPKSVRRKKGDWCQPVEV